MYQSIETYDFELRLGNAFVLCVAFTLLLSFGALDKTVTRLEICGKQWSAWGVGGKSMSYVAHCDGFKMGKKNREIDANIFCEREDCSSTIGKVLFSVQQLLQREAK